MFPLPWNKAYRKKDGSLTTIHEAIAGGGTPYTLPTASSETKGGVKIGSGLTMEGEVLNNSNPTPYTLPTASAETKGGVKIGSRLTVTEGVLSADAQLPASASEDAGKVLTVANDGSVEWSAPSGGGSVEYLDITITSPHASTTGENIAIKTINLSALEGKHILGVFSLTYGAYGFYFNTTASSSYAEIPDPLPASTNLTLFGTVLFNIGQTSPVKVRILYM